MTLILKSKSIIDKKKQGLILACQELTKLGCRPFLKVILVGDNPASLVYTTNKKKFCESIGAKCEIIKLDQNIKEKDFLSIVQDINQDNAVHGLLVQLPLPAQLARIKTETLVQPQKDVDGFHPNNIYAIASGNDSQKSFRPCTPNGIMTLLKEERIDTAGKHAVIIGRSMIVGKPMSYLLTNANATVTLCHSKTKNLESFLERADIIIVAIGKAHFLTKSMLGKNNQSVIVDVGINRDAEGKLCGDVDFDAIKNYCQAITPVPGGVGPMTIYSLAENLIRAARLND